METPNIHIGILSAPSIEFDLGGKYTLSTNSKTLYGACSARLADGQIALANGQNQWLVPAGTLLSPSDWNVDTLTLRAVTIGVDFHWQQQEDQKFQGALKLEIEDQKLVAINIVPVESYLVSVISSEMRADSSLALLKAHAVISRSWLLAQIQKQTGLASTAEGYQSLFVSDTEYLRWWDREDHRLFHVCADDHCQRYQGIGRAQNPNVVRAVLETAGQVLMHAGQIADARFSKCCGGVSELFENCWEPVHYPYLRPIVDGPTQADAAQLQLHTEAQANQWLRTAPDAFCNTTDQDVLRQVLNEYDWAANDFYRWRKEYTREELSELVRRRSGYDFGQITDLVPIERGPSGRLIRLRIEGTIRSLTIGKELVIRRWLSESHLYSSAFVVDKEMGPDGMPTRFVLHGGGWGHGVGLCQIGAAVMGHQGYSYEQILTHYFAAASLEKAY